MLQQKISITLLNPSFFFFYSKYLVTISLTTYQIFFFTKSRPKNLIYFFYLSTLNNSTFIDLFNTKTFLFLTTNSKRIHTINSYFLILFKYFWFKITFRGKGFRVRKFLKNNKVSFSFGRSHWTKIRLNNKIFKVIKIRRQNYIWLTYNWISSCVAAATIKVIKPINRYTKRGLRLKKQAIKKRFGKISQMVSSLHF